MDGVRGDAAKLSPQIAKHKCAQQPPVEGCEATNPATLLVERDGRRVEIEARPALRRHPDVERTRLGFSYAAGPREGLPFGEAFDTSLDRFWFITKQTLGLPARLFDSEQRKEISGIVGSYEVTRQTILNDIAEVVGIMAIISLSLAIVNLFPFLPLDGGHIFWAIVEKVRGRPVPFSVMERAGVVGLHAGDRAVHDRPHQRHRQAVRRGLSR